MSEDYPVTVSGRPTHIEMKQMILWAEEQLADVPEDVRFTTLSLNSPVDGRLRRVATAVQEKGSTLRVGFAIPRHDEQYIKCYGRALALNTLKRNEGIKIQLPSNTVFTVEGSEADGDYPLPFRQRDVLYRTLRQHMVSTWKKSQEEKKDEKDEDE